MLELLSPDYRSDRKVVEELFSLIAVNYSSVVVTDIFSLTFMLVATFFFTFNIVVCTLLIISSDYCYEITVSLTKLLSVVVEVVFDIVDETIEFKELIT